MGKKHDGGPRLGGLSFALLASVVAGCDLAPAGTTTADPPPASQPQACPLEGQPRVPVQISSHAGDMCVRFANGEVWCFGDDGGGVANPLEGVPTAVPVRLPLSCATDIAVDDDHACVVTGADGRVTCWGDNNGEQLGVIDSDQVFVDVGLEHVLKVAVDNSSSFALMADGTVQAWGNLRDSPPRDHGPEPVMGLSDIVGISDDGVYCAVTHAGELLCWSPPGPLNPPGMKAIEPSATPTRVDSLSDVVSIGNGRADLCAVVRDKGLWCWGDNNYGQLGDGTMVPKYTPIQTMTEEVRKVSVSTFANACAVMEDHQLKCWGANGTSAVDFTVGVNEPDVLSPRVVAGVGPALDVATDGAFTCAIQLDGRVLCWGTGFFALGQEVGPTEMFFDDSPDAGP